MLMDQAMKAHYRCFHMAECRICTYGNRHTARTVRACAEPWKEFCLGENRACSVAVAREQV